MSKFDSVAVGGGAWLSAHGVRCWYQAAPAISALVLAVAVAGKAWSSIHGPIAANVPIGWWVDLAHLGFEAVLIGWCCWPRAPRLLRWVALVLWMCYAGIAGHRWLIGQETCGCFGAVHVPGWLTAAVDLLLVCLWWNWRTPPTPPARWRGIAVVMVGAAAVSALAVFRPLATASPLLPEPLRTGRWMVVVYRNDCEVCRQELPRWTQGAIGRGSSPLRRRWAFADAGPAFGDLDAGLPPNVLRLRWPAAPVTTTPTALVIDAGVVVRSITIVDELER